MKKKKVFLKEFSLWKISTIILAILSVTFFFLYYTKQKTQTAGIKDDEIIKKVGTLMILPDEKPQVISVEALQDKLTHPDFYKDSKGGEKLLIFGDRSILYDPKSNKILNIFSTGIFNRIKQDRPFHIALRYVDDHDQYRAQLLRIRIEATNSLFQIVDVSSSKIRYKKEVIYLVNKDRKNEAEQLAKLIGDSPIIEKLEPNEDIINVDAIIAFKAD